MAVAFQPGDGTVDRQVLTHADDEIGANSNRELLEGVQRRPGTATFQPGNGGLGGTHPLGQDRLGQPGLGTEAVDELTKRGNPRSCSNAARVISGLGQVSIESASVQGRDLRGWPALW